MEFNRAIVPLSAAAEANQSVLCRNSGLCAKQLQQAFRNDTANERGRSLNAF